MISFLRRYRRPLFIAVIAIFLIGTFVGLGGYLFNKSDMSETVASVGSTKIPYSRFIVRVNNYVEMLRNQQKDVTDAMIKEVKMGTMRDMIVDELLLGKAEEMGIVVTDDELARDIQNTPAFQQGGQFSQDAYYQIVRTRFRETPAGYEEARRREIKSSRLKQLIFQSAKLSPAEIEHSYALAMKGKKAPKDVEQDKEAFAARLHQQRALELINFFLRQLSSQIEIRTYLDQRESGVS